MTTRTDIPPRSPFDRLLLPVQQTTKQQGAWATVVIVPTGVGAAIGGYAGDATAAVHTIAGASPVCITHPNALNAAAFFNKPVNTLYVEGAALDAVLKGKRVLRPVTRQHIGILWDKGIDPRVQVIQTNTLNAVKTLYGISVVAEQTTREALDLWCDSQPNKPTQGGLRNPGLLLEAAETLRHRGATAIALCVAFPDALVGENAYLQGNGPDPVGGLEAILSHYIVQQLGVPCAHAPVFSLAASQPETDQIVDPRVAAEVITPTFLPCILLGLSQAPDLVPIAHYNPETDWGLPDIRAVFVPHQTLGGPGTLAALYNGIPVVAIEANTTVCTTPAINPTTTVADYQAAAEWLSSIDQFRQQ